MLAGGLGASPYIYANFQQFAKESLKEKIDVIRPQDAWSLVARGAAIGGLEKSPVTFRRCRDSIGFCVHEKYVQGKHKPADRFQCPVEGTRAKNQMRWHVFRVSDNL